VTFRDRLLATEADAAATLVVSQDVDLAIPVEVHDEVKARLERITRLVPSAEEPSVWVPRPEARELIEVNFIGLDRSIVDPMDTYEKEDDRLPLMVFGPLSLLTAGAIATMAPADLDQLERECLGLPADLRHQVRSNLSILSLLDARPGMPDPRPHRPAVDGLLRRLEAR
jgi:hypothetical protein